MNLYTGSREGFSDFDRRLASIYTVHAGLALAGLRTQDQLRDALATRQRIGQAVGILIERRRLTEKQGLDLLVRASQDNNVRLYDVADWLVVTGEEPSGTGQAGDVPEPRTKPATDTASPGQQLRVVPLEPEHRQVRLEGEIDPSTHAVLAATLEQLEDGPPDVHLDLSGLAFIDVAGTRLLIHTADRLRERGGQLFLHHPPHALIRIVQHLFQDGEIGNKGPLELPYW